MTTKFANVLYNNSMKCKTQVQIKRLIWCKEILHATTQNDYPKQSSSLMHTRGMNYELLKCLAFKLVESTFIVSINYKQSATQNNCYMLKKWEVNNCNLR